jgi:type II secretory pathway component PulJ
MTLLEVLISVVLLAFISIFTFQTIQTSMKHKNKTQKDIDQQAAVAAALRIMERDISLAFHFRDIAAEVKAQLDEDAKKTSQNPQANPNSTGQVTPTPVANPNSETPSRPKIVTHFIGESNKINLATLGNVRTFQDSKESDQNEVGYSLKSCSSPTTMGGGNTSSSQCLVRRVSTLIDEDVEKGGDETVLLENITEFKLKYIGKGKDEWVEEWKTDNRGDTVTQGMFPTAVEITISTEVNKRTVTLSTVAALRFPNNPEKAPASGEAGSANTQNPNSPSPTSPNNTSPGGTGGP